MSQLITRPVRMSSTDIANLTGKRHDHVLRDIRKMLDALGDSPNLGDVEEVKDARGYTVHLMLQRREVEILLTGYSVPLRAKVIDRLHELEAFQRDVAQPAIALPQSFSDALRLAADLHEEKLKLTALNHSLQVDNERLQPAATIGTAVGSLKHMSVMDFARKLEGVDLTQVQKTLGTMNYLYRRNGCWAVYAKYNGKLFSEKAAPDGRSVVVILPAGQQLLTKLYLNGDLKMRKGCAPVVGGN